MTETLQWSDQRQIQISDNRIQSLTDKVCLVFERNNENFLPKELHMELKKLLTNYLDALRFKEETFMNIIKMLNNCIQTTINKVSFSFTDSHKF